MTLMGLELNRRLRFLLNLQVASKVMGHVRFGFAA